MLSADDQARFCRQVVLPEVGKRGQERLKNARVLVIGAGGLGCPALQYLAAAGVGTLGVVDPDTVDISNLQRQILFTVQDVGRLKVDAAARRLQALYPDCTVNIFPQRCTVENGRAMASEYELVIDGSDNFPTRYLVNDICDELGVPFVAASVQGFVGQIGVFNARLADGARSASYRCVFPEPPDGARAPRCSETGVLGVVPGILGTLQASEALKLLLGIGEPLVNSLLVVDCLTLNFQRLRTGRVEERSYVRSAEAYGDVCGETKVVSQQISPRELKQRLDTGEDIFLLDVREHGERHICNIGGLHVPMGELQRQLDKVPKDRDVVVYCRSGARSDSVVSALVAGFGFSRVWNLEGGILRWIQEIDPSLQRY